MRWSVEKRAYQNNQVNAEKVLIDVSKSVRTFYITKTLYILFFGGICCILITFHSHPKQKAGHGNHS